MHNEVAAERVAGFDMVDWATQLRKGLLEMVVLAKISLDGEAYGYAIVEKLSCLPGLELSESTVYPMLSRLAKDRLLAVRNEPSPAGPPRRYYRLTPLGIRRLGEMQHTWKLVSQSVAALTEGGVS
jgi:PadR family transcriptional regulator PadR